ncbi:MAG TPA: hypothetical protein PLP49_11855 [Anaerohalosphaeraceae bacterium]|jgi:hypothetical protein|nr:hypothetical protein [Anaerohalosphaeraceae bacterium]
MKIMRKFDMVLVFAVLLIIGMYVSWHIWKAFPVAYGHNLVKIKICLLYYIEQNSGEFPSSEEDLLQKGFLKVDNSHIYVQFPNTASTIESHRCFRFRAFTIRYGTKFEDLKLFKGVLVDKKTNKEVLLINGPCRFLLPYKDYSIEIYEKMLTIKEKNRNS